MAQVARDVHLDERIDGYLAYLLKRWQGIPRLTVEWADWDEDSRVVFDLNWAVAEDRLAQLGSWDARGHLTSDQQARFRKLQAIVAEYRLTLDRMLAE
jgi:hypothetical protein